MFNNPFLKKDPLLEAVKGAMQDGDIRRQAIAHVNEEFGVFNRNGLVRENLAAYDARIEEAYKCMKEGKPLSPKQEKMAAIAGDPKKIDAADLKALRSGKKMNEKKGCYEEGNDGNLANNYPPYDKVTRGDVIAGRLGKDQMGGKKKVDEKKGCYEEGAMDSDVVGGGSVTKDNKPVVSSTASKVNTSGPSAADRAGLAAKIGAMKEAKKMEEGKKWISKAIKKPGALSKQLGVPEKENIPAKKLKAASDEPGKLGKRARLAQTLKKMARKRTMEEELNIAKGDTLSSLAKKNNTSVDALAKANNIKDVNKIQAGSSLKLPTVDKTPAPTTSWVNPSTKDYSASNKGVDKPATSAPLPSMSTASPKTGAGAGVSSLPGASQSASITNPKPSMDPGSMENAKRQTGSLNEGVQVGDKSYRII
jgi:LysM repeat protein